MPQGIAFSLGSNFCGHMNLGFPSFVMRHSFQPCVQNVVCDWTVQRDKHAYQPFTLLLDGSTLSTILCHPLFFLTLYEFVSSSQKVNIPHQFISSGCATEEQCYLTPLKCWGLLVRKPPTYVHLNKLIICLLFYLLFKIMCFTYGPLFLIFCSLLFGKDLMLHGQVQYYLNVRYLVIIKILRKFFYGFFYTFILVCDIISH